MRAHPYRSKMACTPAMAFRLFSSLEEEVDFSAGPGAGIAGGGGGGVWPITRKANRRSKQITRLFSPVTNSSSEPCLSYSVMYTTAVAISAWFRDGRIYNPQRKVPRSPGHGFGPGDCCVDPGTGPGNDVVGEPQVPVTRQHLASLPIHLGAGAQARPAVTTTTTTTAGHSNPTFILVP